MKNIYCKHFEKESKKTSIYIYRLVNTEIHLCNACEKKLRKEILKQIKIEEE